MSSHVIYARKSSESDDRQVLSIDSQVQELKLLALRRGFEVDEVLTEARSAKAPGRPIFGQLMKRIGRGEISAVLCWKMDRLARNHLDTGHVLQALADSKLPRVITPERDYTADGNDRFLGNFELGIATKFIDDLRQNVRRGNRARFQRGWPNYRPPIGYLEDRSGPTTTIIQDPERFPIVRRMWDHLLSGAMSPIEICRWAESRGLKTRKTAQLGGKPLVFQYVYRLFSNPFYMGIIQLRNGESYKGSHQPMVSPAEFEDAQAILGRPRRSHRTRHLFAYAGLLTCGLCGKTLVPEAHVKLSGKRFVYYRCRGRTDQASCPNPAVSEGALEAQITASLERVSLRPRASEWIRTHVHATVDASSGQALAQRTALEKALADSQREGDALLTLRLREQVDEATFERRRLDLLEQQAKLRIQLEQPMPAPNTQLDRLERVLSASETLPRSFREGDSVRRRQIFLAVCANPVVRGRKALYKAKEPWSFFEGSGHVRSWCTVVDQLRIWIGRADVEVPDFSVNFELEQPAIENRRRAGVGKRGTRRGHLQP